MNFLKSALLNNNFRGLCLFFFTICNSITAQICSNAVNAPTTINGISVTGSGVGFSTYPYIFYSCGNVATPANSLLLGQTGSFSYTYTFSAPVNNLVIAITGTGSGLGLNTYENFIISTNGGGTPIINDLNSCFTSIVGNEILSGAGGSMNGGGGVFEINNTSPYTSITITGSGGDGGSVVALCAASVAVVANPVLTAVVVGSTSVCQNGISPDVTFTGSNGTAPYTFTFTLNSGPSQTITSIGNAITIPVPTNASGIFTYNLESVTDASGLINSQIQTASAVITVNPLPSALISGTTSVCQNATSPTVTFTGANTTAPYTFTYNINGGAPQTVTSVGNVATVNAPTTIAGIFTYNLESVVDASGTSCSQVQIGNAIITVNELPTAIISGGVTVCQNAISPTVTFTGSNTTAPYTFTYNINGGAPQTLTSVGDVATVNVPTGIAGTFNYNLVSVVDASGILCSNLQTGTAVMIVTPSPLANIFGDIEVCLNTTEDTYVTFVGSNGTAPYTFSYIINGGAIQTVTSSANTSTVLVPTNIAGTFEYNLVNVTDASSTVCASVFDESISVVVRPLPTAQIIGGDSLCLNTGNAVIEFVGAFGENPYILNYSINGGNAQTISTVAVSNNVFINAPSTNAGTFVYSLISVSESGLSCTQNQVGNIVIVIHPDPISSFTPTPNVIMLYDNDNVSQLINSSFGATSYFWDFGDGSSSTFTSPYHQFEIKEQESFDISLTATSEFGCISSSVETITVKDDELIYVPNTFTPNGNEFNNVFKPVIYSGIDVSSYTFEIYNRWGALLFMTKDPSNGWDGTFKGNVSQDGVYNWRIEYTTESKQNGKVLIGNINLLR